MTFQAYQSWVDGGMLKPQPGKEHEFLLFPAVGLAEEAGEVAGQIKRLMRDDGGVLTTARRLKIVYELGDALFYLTAMAGRIGFSLEQVADLNKSKIDLRRDAGKLHGEGSDR
jgi:NTP pyrophosphatase (non-canonical NTP hydrolase)